MIVLAVASFPPEVDAEACREATNIVPHTIRYEQHISGSNNGFRE